MATIGFSVGSICSDLSENAVTCVRRYSCLYSLSHARNGRVAPGCSSVQQPSHPIEFRIGDFFFLMKWIYRNFRIVYMFIMRALLFQYFIQFNKHIIAVLYIIINISWKHKLYHIYAYLIASNIGKIKINFGRWLQKILQKKNNK